VTGAFAGGAHHVNFSKFAKLAGFDFQWIPFEGGSEAVADVMGGHSMAGQTNPGNVKGQYEGKKLKILGVTTDKRLESLPNVPTFKELGWDYEAYHWRGIIAKKGIPDDVVKILEDALLKAVKDPQFQDYLKRTEQLSWPKTAAELGKVIQEDTDGTWEIVKALMKK
jgi:tripartite-type tricarboxylate transporter receptor subunit TctC